MFSCSYGRRGSPGASNQQPGGPKLTPWGPLTNNQEAPGARTNNQGILGLLTDSQAAPEPLTEKRGLRGL